MIDKQGVGDYICHDCGMKYGKPRSSCATFYHGYCDYCNKNKIVTESRDYCYPELPWKNVYDDNKDSILGED